ncbi:hypothetical protein [Streptomyces sp. NBC_00306]|uniref:hypothetical protein n=1 Tax=Streptomyces sp. NBC_00306 TaxID=2975708 RepID=UPI002E290620|nr:hypothetical protein [Streptomyces sp. NBC_00306]
MSKTAPASPTASPAQRQREPGTPTPTQRRQWCPSVRVGAVPGWLCWPPPSLRQAAGGFLTWQKTGERTPVLAVAQIGNAGDVIEESDLTDTSVSLDPEPSSRSPPR